MSLKRNKSLKPNHIFQKTFTFFLIWTPIILTAQQWTPPVNISNLEEYFTLKSDFTIDNSGVIHCVWNVKYEHNLGKVFYSKSEDDGENWSEAVHVSKNEEYYCTGPHIAHDSENNIYVTYDLNDYSKDRWGSNIYFTKKDSAGWSDPIFFSEGLENRVVVDHNDRVYVFWYMRSPAYGEFYYKYFEEGTWSEIICPYFANWKLGINSMVPDLDNNLHCTGFYAYADSGLYDDHTVYFWYDLANDQWSDEFVDFSFGHSTYNDISLDTNQHPQICWGEKINTKDVSLVTYYSGYDGNTWSEKLIITEEWSQSQRILIDSLNRKHITVVEVVDWGCKLIYFHQPNGSNWESMLVDQCNNAIFTPELHFKNDKLYTVYDKSNVPYEGNIFISKLELLTTIWEDNISPDSNYISLKNYPNPFSDKTNIAFVLNKPGLVRLDIFNMEGGKVTTLTEKYYNKGNYEIIWDCVNYNSQALPAGPYLLVIQFDNQYKTQIISLTN